MATVNIYLHFNGNCEEAFDFYRSVLGGEFGIKMRYKDVPQENNLSDEKENIIHVALPVGKTAVLMGSDRPSSFGPAKIGDHAFVSLSVDSEAEADRVFSALSAGGQPMMPMHKTFWGAYFGMLADKFRVQWMINYEYNK